MVLLSSKLPPWAYTNHCMPRVTTQSEVTTVNNSVDQHLELWPTVYYNDRFLVIVHVHDQKLDSNLYCNQRALLGRSSPSCDVNL